MFNATFNNISVISRRSVLLVEDTGGLGENHRPQGRIQDFKLGGALKKIAPNGGRREHFWSISCENHDFTQKKSHFFPILGGGAPPPPGSPPGPVANLFYIYYFNK